jgi:hypothetical protein
MLVVTNSAPIPRAMLSESTRLFTPKYMGPIMANQAIAPAAARKKPVRNRFCNHHHDTALSDTTLSSETIRPGINEAPPPGSAATR